jgi:hypothetical protein
MIIGCAQGKTGLLVAYRAIGPQNEAVFKKAFENNSLLNSLNHVCVLFVQHPAGNALQQAV